jgi:poly(3-hydroxybutyrate) depolymerase
VRTALVTLTVLLALAAPVRASARRPLFVRVEHISYRAHDGRLRPALLLLPRGYHGQQIPLVISPHGRNTLPRADAKRWGRLPFEGGFAVICPGGEGRRLPLYSWGAPGQVADLARMPAIAAAHGVHVERGHVYAVGDSMGGQETLLLVARYPRLLAGAIAFDPVVDLGHRYRQFGPALQRLAQLEVGGTPGADPGAYAVRSPDHYIGAIGRSHVPLEIYWSQHDGVLMGERRAVDRFVTAIERRSRTRCTLVYRGDWHHAAAMEANRQLGPALTRLGLLPPSNLTSAMVTACGRSATAA